MKGPNRATGRFDLLSTFCHQNHRMGQPCHRAERERKDLSQGNRRLERNTATKDRWMDEYLCIIQVHTNWFPLVFQSLKLASSKCPGQERLKNVLDTKG